METSAGMTDEGVRARRELRPDDGQRARPRRRPRLTGPTNVGQVERALSVAAGGALALLGARRRGLPGAAMAAAGMVLLQRGATGHCAVYESLGVNTVEGGRPALEQQHGPAAVLDASQAVRVEQSVTINRPREELYRYWRTLDNLPRVMRHLESVTVLGDRHSRWKAKAPAGMTVEWDAVIHNEIENELLAWKSVGDATVPNAGSVHFADAPGGRGTELRVLLEYDPPAGMVGRVVAKLFGEEPGAQVREDLRRFKSAMEAGEMLTTEGQPSGRR